MNKKIVQKLVDLHRYFFSFSCRLYWLVRLKWIVGLKIRCLIWRSTYIKAKMRRWQSTTCRYTAGVNGYQETRERQEGAVKIAPAPARVAAPARSSSLDSDAIIRQVPIIWMFDKTLMILNYPGPGRPPARHQRVGPVRGPWILRCLLHVYKWLSIQAIIK